MLGLLLTWTAGQPWQIEMGWPGIHWLARGKGGLIAAMFKAWVSVESADGARVGFFWVAPHRRTTEMGSIGDLVMLFCWP
jgi:hypothetical protein